MAKYRVLPSAAHNYGASFISVMNIAGGDYAICHLLRAARQAGVAELRVDLLTGGAEPAALVPPPVAESVAAYCRGFGAHVERSGSALDMLTEAELRLRIAWGRVAGAPDPEPLLRARLHCEVALRDDRGKLHVGRTTEDWVCHPTRHFY